MNEVMDFEETESLNEDIFDCEYTSVDAVINEVTVFTGCKEIRKDRQRTEREHLSPMARVSVHPLSILTARS